MVDAAKEKTTNPAGWCATCWQSHEDDDRDYLPEKNKVVWHKLGKDEQGNRCVPQGTECYKCYDTRRKHCPGCTATQCIQYMKESSAYRENFMRLRRLRCVGDKYKNKGTSEQLMAPKMEATTQDKSFRTGEMEGMFYSVKRYISGHCKRCPQDSWLQSAPEEVQQTFIVEQLGLELIQSQDEIMGIEVWDHDEECHKIRRGASTSATKTLTRKYQEGQEEEHHQEHTANVKRLRLTRKAPGSSSSTCGVSSAMTSTGKVTTIPFSSQASTLAFRPDTVEEAPSEPPSEAAHGHWNSKAASWPAAHNGDTTAGPDHDNGNGNDNDQAAADHADKTAKELRLSLAGLPSSIAATVKTNVDPESTSSTTASPRPGSTLKKKLESVAARSNKRKSVDPRLLLTQAEELTTELDAKFGVIQLWEERYRQRDISSVTTTINTFAMQLSSACGSVGNSAGDSGACDASLAERAQQLHDRACAINQTWALFHSLRSASVASCDRVLTDAEQQVLRSLPSTLLANVLTFVGTNLSTRLETLDDHLTFSMFCRCQRSPKMSLGLFLEGGGDMVQQASRVQNSLAPIQVEKLVKSNSTFFHQVVSTAVMKGIWPDSAKLPGEKVSCNPTVGGWFETPFLDFEALQLFAHVLLQTRRGGHIVASLTMRQQCKLILKNVPKWSLRLRALARSAGTSSANRNIAFRGYEVAQEIAANETSESAEAEKLVSAVQPVTRLVDLLEKLPEIDPTSTDRNPFDTAYDMICDFINNNSEAIAELEAAMRACKTSDSAEVREAYDASKKFIAFVTKLLPVVVADAKIFDEYVAAFASGDPPI